MVIEWAGNDRDSSVEYQAVSSPICGEGEVWGGRGRGGLVEPVVPLNSISNPPSIKGWQY